MAIDRADLPRILLERIGAAAPSHAILVADELSSWPHGVAEALVRCGLLQEVSRASSVVCSGCERNCVKPVVVRAPLDAEDRARIFVVCDEEPDLGRITIPAQRLLRHSATLLALARLVARALDHDRPRELGDGLIVVGSIAGRYGARLACIGVKDCEVRIFIGHLWRPLCELLKWRDATLTVDVEEVARLANQKAHSAKAYAHSTVRREARKLETHARHVRWQREYRRLKRNNPKLSDEAIAATIAASEIGERREPTTIRRYMKV